MVSRQLLHWEMPKITKIQRYDAKCQLYHKTKAVYEVHCTVYNMKNVRIWKDTKSELAERKGERDTIYYFEIPPHSTARL